MNGTDKIAELVGWDIGGANLKLARLADGVPIEIVQLPCPLLASPEKFDRAVTEAFEGPLRHAQPVLHAVTMTGELSDVFAERQQGVGYIVRLMQRAVGPVPLLIYAGRSGFLSPEAAIAEWNDVASANWLATASLAARRLDNGLLIDIGTTTADLIPLHDGTAAARGYTDAERLTEGELVYTGVVRTPVMALGSRAPWREAMQGVAAERFATMADIHRLTGDLPDDADPYPSADQRGKSRAESAARLARMLGRDACEAPLSDWIALARWFAERQLDQLAAAAEGLIARDAIPPDAPVVGAGCGRFVAQHLASRLGRPYRDFAELAGAPAACAEMAARAAPALSVALLAAQHTARDESAPATAAAR